MSKSVSATKSNPAPKLFQLDACGFEFHAIIVKSIPENRRFDTIKLFKCSRELIYLRPESVSSFPENHRLLLRGPKVGVFGDDESGIVIGHDRWDWSVGFDRYNCRKDGIQSVLVRDPDFPEAAVEVIFERIAIPTQAHFRIIFEDDMNMDREINIVRGEISTMSNKDPDTKRLLRCFGEDLKKHMFPSEEPDSKKIKLNPSKLVSGETIDLYRDQMIVPATSEFIIDFKLELEFDTGGGKTQFLFIDQASCTAPDEPVWLEYKELIDHAMQSTKVKRTLKIDDSARIRVEISWFNDRTDYVHPNRSFTLWGYRDGDCDYKGIGVTWADKQERRSDE